MQRQTVDALLPLLPLLQQPAFCIRSNGTILYNESAKTLSPSCAAALPNWLGEGNVMYDMWDRTGNLQLPLTVLGRQYSVTLQALQDGTLFLLSPCTVDNPAVDALFVASQTLRQPLSDLNSLFQSMPTETDDATSAAAYRQLYRMTRIVSNLTELTRLNQPAPHLHFSQTDTGSFLGEFLEETQALIQPSGRTLHITLPKKTVQFQADEQLLKRALLNLISNALKFSPANSPLRFHVDAIGTHLVFQLENDCTDDGSELLRSAFSRLSRREVLPDPKWGVGLGLPLAHIIARLHGGMVAIETNNRKATVSLSVSLRRSEQPTRLGALVADYTGGMRQTLLELSDTLPNDAYRK